MLTVVIHADSGADEAMMASVAQPAPDRRRPPEKGRNAMRSSDSEQRAARCGPGRVQSSRRRRGCTQMDREVDGGLVVVWWAFDEPAGGGCRVLEWEERRQAAAR
jgi:hypothetical protein